MKRSEAEKLIGELVITGYVNGGLYVGELLEIIPSKPFRALVKVKWIHTYPDLYCHNTRGAFKDRVIIRKKDEIVETGNRIKKYELHTVSYDESIKLSLQRYLENVEDCLKRYLKNDNHFSHYINSKEHCLKLKDIIIERLENVELN